MAKHTVNISEDKSKSKFRVMCSCTWSFTTKDHRSAKYAAGQHLKAVVNELKPQKTLDI